MKKHLRNGILLAFAASSLFSLEKAEEESIRKVVNGYVHSWNYECGRGFADGFSEDASFVNIFGMDFKGRDEIEKRHIHILETFLKDSKFEVMDFNIREAAPNLVIAHVRWRVEGHNQMGSAEKAPAMTGIFSHTFFKKDGRWEIISCQNTLDSKGRSS